MTELDATPASTLEILQAALNDERKAEATYDAVIRRFGPVRPFVNIVEAERRHQEAILQLFERRGWAAGPNRWKGNVHAPATVKTACEEAIKVEEANIALYDRLIPSIADGDIRLVLTNLQRASRERHLPAFRRCASRF